MPRKNLIRSIEHPYHITARGNNKEDFPLSPEKSWSVFCKVLEKMRKDHEFKIHAFVMMKNHFHLLASTPGDDLGIIMREFMRTITRSMNRISGRSGRVFGSSYHWSIIYTDTYFDCALKYVYRNPVKAGITSTVQDYEFSSIRSALGNEKLLFPIEPVSWTKQIIPNNAPVDFLKWMNLPYKTEDDALIKRSMKKTIFTPPLDGWKQKSFSLEHCSLNAANLKK